MTKPTRTEINCETQEVTVVELTDAEIAEMVAAAEAYTAEQAEREAAALAAAEAKASAEAKLTALGLTSDEVAAIIGR